jgi:hypothetical protein
MKLLPAMAFGLYMTAVAAQSNLPSGGGVASFDEPWALAFLPDDACS